MYLVVIGWIYVALMMAVVEATSPQGTAVGAVFTFLLYGVGPLALVMYILRTPQRRRTRRAREASAVSVAPPHGGDHASGTTVASEREEP